MPVAVSYDSKQRYGLQSPFTEGTNRMFKGGMWHVDSTHNTLITTGNGGSESTKAQVSLFYNGGKSQYRLEKLLAPGQQLLLDVGQLIRNQVPDSDGNVIPPETMTGSYELRDLDHPAVGLLYEGKLTIDKTYGHASYGCGNCCGLYDTKLMPNPYNGPPSVYNQDSYLARSSAADSGKTGLAQPTVGKARTPPWLPYRTQCYIQSVSAPPPEALRISYRQRTLLQDAPRRLWEDISR